MALFPEMNCCVQCGTKLLPRYHAEEGTEIPWCPECAEYRFPIFSAGVVLIILNESRTHALMIRQYGDERYYLVAGYINKGETAEHAAAREMREEVGLEAARMEYNGSNYFAPSNTLLFSFAVTATGQTVTANAEVEDYCWVPVEEAIYTLPKHELAEQLLRRYYTKQ